jgi:hypothetical protein
MILQERSPGPVDEPPNPGVRGEVGAEEGKQRQGVDDVPQGTGLHHEDAAEG